MPTWRYWLIALEVALPALSNRVVVHAPAPFAISAMTEGPDGMLYLAGPRGLYRYDGYRYDLLPGSPFKTAYQLALTSRGVLWFSSIEGIAHRQTDGTFVKVLGPDWRRVGVVNEYAFANSRDGERLLRIDEKGGQVSLSARDNCADGGFWRIESAVWLTCHDRSAWFALDARSLRLTRQSGPTPRRGPVRDSSGREWFISDEGIVFGPDSKSVAAVTIKNNNQPLVQGYHGQVWLADGAVLRGLSPQLRFPWNAGSADLSVAPRRNGGAWAVRRHDSELRELIPDPAWRQWSTAEIGGSPPMQVVRNSSRELILLTKSQLYRLNERTDEWRIISAMPTGCQCILPLPDGSYLVCGADGVLTVPPAGRSGFSIHGTDAEFFRRHFRKLLRLSDGRIAMANRYGLFEWMSPGGPLTLVRLPAVWHGWSAPAGDELFPAVTDLQLDRQGHAWAAYGAGIARRDQAGLWRQTSQIPYPSSLAFGPSGEIWLTNRSDGALSFLKDGKLRLVRPPQDFGLETDSFVAMDRRGWVWHRTGRGTHVSDGRHTDAGDWVFLPPLGKPAHTGFFADDDGTVWLLSDDGIVRVRPGGSWFAETNKIPVVSSVDIDGKTVQSLPDGFDAMPKTITIRIARVDSPSHWLEPTAYRLLPTFSDWRLAPNGVVQLKDLSAGAYHLELRQKGLSAVLRYKFRLGPSLLNSLWWLAVPAAAMGWLASRHRERIAYRARKGWHLFRWRRRYSAHHIREENLTGRLLRERYHLRRRIAEGGFAQVYEAYDRATDCSVAVKLHHKRVNDAVWARARFAQEITALQMVDHPGIVRVLDFWVAPGGEPCLVMPFLDGDSLREQLDGIPWAPAEAARTVELVGAALAALHSAGVVHRDLTPENIVMTRDRGPVLVDLGSSGLTLAEETATTALLAGSIEYLAPERLTGHYSPASDTFALATIAFEMLAGRKLAHSRLELFGSSFANELRSLLPDGVKETTELLAEALHPVPERRPANVHTWAGRFAGALRGVATAGALPSSQERSPHPQPLAMPDDAGESQPHSSSNLPP